MKICEDCRWHRSGYCHSPNNQRNIVTGSKTVLCENNRIDPPPLHFWFGTCGKAGRWWERKVTQITALRKVALTPQISQEGS